MSKTKSKSKSNNFLLFTNSCLYDSGGQKVNGPYPLCYFFIFLMVFSLIVNIIQTITDRKQYHGISKIRFFLAVTTSIMITMFSIYFMYNMCYICHGFVGLLMLICISIITSVIHSLIFPKFFVIDQTIKLNRMKTSTGMEDCNCN